MSEKLLVVSAHPGDWVWRCSGTMAKYIQAGAEVHLLLLTLGARSESDELWKKNPGIMVEDVKNARRNEVLDAAHSLGVTDIEIWDYDDCPLVASPEIIQRLNIKIRTVRPTVIITHDECDCTNFDHDVANQIVVRALLMSRQIGIPSKGLPPCKNVQVYGIEPAQPELSGFVPRAYVDITDVFDKKKAAMECMKTQPRNPTRHTYVTQLRGRQARVMPGGEGAEYAESFTVRFPIVTKNLLP